MVLLPLRADHSPHFRPSSFKRQGRLIYRGHAIRHDPAAPTPPPQLTTLGFGPVHHQDTFFFFFFRFVSFRSLPLQIPHYRKSSYCLRHLRHRLQQASPWPPPTFRGTWPRPDKFAPFFVFFFFLISIDAGIPRAERLRCSLRPPHPHLPPLDHPATSTWLRHPSTPPSRHGCRRHLDPAVMTRLPPPLQPLPLPRYGRRRSCYDTTPTPPASTPSHRRCLDMAATATSTPPSPPTPLTPTPRQCRTGTVSTLSPLPRGRQRRRRGGQR
ncbi:hypothetical protein EDB92DRAFT_634835 [Lactarius akahatsu]|uniref:Uncharacterized protein n=1 Tax=Lactarius akahatsu TaxID=416441 RepID=A0AAD4Q4Y8_9AGAM|nr:hypothetical protein EDB92DRAFT_634835 [Lactarius akahatsu]